MSIHRYIQNQVAEDLKRKMVFIGGPRQVGKTTLAMSVVKNPLYLNWDIDEDRTAILDKRLGTQEPIIFDEIHKFKKWRNYLKGLFDKTRHKEHFAREILVTGSARLDYYRYGGDSLQGRYYYIRLMPFSFAELKGAAQPDELFNNLLKFSGFPEPLFSQSEKESKRWSREYRARLIRDDLRDLEKVEDLATFELLSGRIPECVGGPLSINSLREDLRVAHATVSKWINMLERMYYIFRIPPMGAPTIRAVKKEQKAYCYDWTLVEDENCRFENMTAVHLQKYVYWLQDTEGRNVELRYFRDKDGREVDFVVLENKNPILFVECKASSHEISKSLQYLVGKFPRVPSYQIVFRSTRNFQTPEGIRLCPANHLFEQLI